MRRLLWKLGLTVRSIRMPEERGKRWTYKLSDIQQKPRLERKRWAASGMNHSFRVNPLVEGFVIEKVVGSVQFEI